MSKIEKKWSVYAAGVVATAGASAHGAIVAQSVNLPFNVDTLAANVDFNSDGVVDYQLLRGREGGDPAKDYVDLKQGVNAGLGSTNRFVLDVPSNRIASLTAGTLIGPASSLDSNFDGATASGGSVSLYDERKQGNGQPGPSGNFNPDDIVGNPEYVGVRFKLGGAGIDYYGWIAVDFTNRADVAGAVTGFGYEDSGAAISAGAIPEPAGLGLLAVGAAALLRRKGR